MMLIIYAIVFIVSIYLTCLCWDSESDNKYMNALFNTGSIVFIVIAMISFLGFLFSIPGMTKTDNKIESSVVEEYNE